jgi:hypothetical protein
MTQLLCRAAHGRDTDVDDRRSHRVKTRCPELTSHAFTIHDLGLTAPLTTNCVEIPRAAGHLVLAKPFDGDARVTSLCPLNGFGHLFFAAKFNHFFSPV